MVYFGKVKDGWIRLEPPVSLPDGTVVRVEPVEKDDPVYHLGDDAVDAPSGQTDLAAEHDHYIYGTPKRGEAQ